LKVVEPSPLPQGKTVREAVVVDRALADMTKKPPPLLATTVPGAKQELSIGAPIGTRSLVPTNTNMFGLPEVQLAVAVKVMVVNSSAKVVREMACPKVRRYPGGTVAPDQGITPPMGIVPGGTAHVASARRNFRVPPPEAGTQPLVVAVKNRQLAQKVGSPPPPPPFSDTNRVLAQALEESPAGRSEQVVFWACTCVTGKTPYAAHVISPKARRAFLNIAFHHC
jgi:hypothetical protein